MELRHASYNTSLPTVVLVNGGRSVVTEAGNALLAFFNPDTATVLRAVSCELRDIIGDYPWENEYNVPVNKVADWRSCFPRAKHAHLEGNLPAKAFVHLRSLVELHLYSVPFLGRVLAGEYPRLTWLDLDEGIDNDDEEEDYTGRRLTDADFTALNCPLLTTLSLFGCDGITGLGGLHCPLLTNIYVLHCEGITDTGLAALKCPLLTTLNLSYCESITDIGLAALHYPLLNLHLSHCEGITDTGLAELKCPLLTTLNLSECKSITDAGLAALHCPLLESLYLRNCISITDTGLAALKCPLLATLNILHCEGITDTGLEALKCPLLVNLNLS